MQATNRSAQHKDFREVIMVLAIFCFILLVVLISAGAAKAETWKSSMHIANATWFEDSAKFRLISRWGMAR